MSGYTNYFIVTGMQYVSTLSCAAWNYQLEYEIIK